MEVLVTWSCPRCEGKHASQCPLCEGKGRIERWLPQHLLKELKVYWKILARREATE